MKVGGPEGCGCGGLCRNPGYRNPVSLRNRVSGKSRRLLTKIKLNGIIDTICRNAGI
jgi:hypothetical protein